MWCFNNKIGPTRAHLNLDFVSDNWRSLLESRQVAHHWAPAHRVQCTRSKTAPIVRPTFAITRDPNEGRLKIAGRCYWKFDFAVRRAKTLLFVYVQIILP